jgi:hypothetical protein
MLKHIEFGPQPKKATLTVEMNVADMVRRLASYEGRPKKLSDLLSDMLEIYIKERHPGVKVIVGKEERK